MPEDHNACQEPQIPPIAPMVGKGSAPNGKAAPTAPARLGTVTGSVGPMKLLKEPLVHFVATGAVLFAAYGWINRNSVEIAGVQPVTIGDGEVRWVSETWSNQWLRTPSRQELKDLVGELVDEELLAREALEMGLDKDDTIIRRRLAQKLKFMLDDTARLVDPSDDVLRAYYSANAARFAPVATVSFSHIFFSSDSRPDAQQDAKTVLASGPAADSGDRFLPGGELADADQRTVESVFGPDFARNVFTVEPGIWTGPLKSSYGFHLVRLDRKSEAAQPGLDRVRDDVLSAWRADKQAEAYRAYLARLREKYGVRYDDGVKAMLQEPPAERTAAK
jgi:hypothetical protein